MGDKTWKNGYYSSTPMMATSACGSRSLDCDDSSLCGRPHLPCPGGLEYLKVVLYGNILGFYINGTLVYLDDDSSLTPVQWASCTMEAPARTTCWSTGQAQRLPAPRILACRAWACRTTRSRRASDTAALEGRAGLSRAAIKSRNREVPAHAFSAPA